MDKEPKFDGVWMHGDANDILKVVIGQLDEAKREVERLRVALEVILNQIDYTAGRCRQTEMIGALITKQEFQIARRALAGEE